jgi:diaminohydroxyphosphoribosylaminopyrimidine deaminase/5-amino-6-(5-phosphoribosylamino)uracil reductase
MVGRGTAVADDPLLTARPPGPRTPVRIVLDTQARLSPTSRLVRSATDAPVIVATGPAASPAACRALLEAGAEVLALSASDPMLRMQQLVQELGRRQMTHLLVEGGAAVFGALADLGLIDEVHAFIAPLLAGGAGAPSPLAGVGVAVMSAAQRLEVLACERLDDDVYVRGRIVRPAA